jgi:hypothetical protein
VTFTATDDLVVVSIDPPVVISTEGAAQEITGTATDTAGQKGTTSIKINLDKTAPQTTAETPAPGASGWYNADVNITLSAVDTLSGLSNTQYRINGGQWQNSTGLVKLSSEGSNLLEYQSIDIAGNEETIKSMTLNIDKIAPTATVSYNTTAPTNQDVIAAITPSEAVIVTNNGGATAHTFSENGSFTFEFVDVAGNTGTVTATVANIDKIAPTASVSYSKTTPTNQDVIATITPSEAVTVTNNGGATAYTFSENGSFTFEFVDAAGNTGTVTATVTNIDKVAPTATVAYNTTVPTNQDVVATITPSEDVTITNNGGSKSYTFTQNGSFTFSFVDAAGNTGTATATVANIDKVAPTLIIKLNKYILSPPNHKMVPIHATLVSQDNNPGPLSIVLKSITSNEPDNGKGDGNTINDIQGAAIGTLDADFMLRAERSSKGTGRIYTITYTITDAAGNQSTAIATVKVNKGTKDDDRDQHDDHENDGHESQDN